MRPRRTVLAAMAIGLGLGLAACGQPGMITPAAQPPAEGGGNVPGQASVRWADDYCTAVGGLVQALTTMPTVDPTTPQRASRTSGELLGTMVSGLDGAARDLARLGPSPVPGGDKVREDAVARFTGIRDRAEDAKKRLERASDDPEESKQALGRVSASVDELAKLNLLEGFDAVPGLANASTQAAACRPLFKQTLSPGASPESVPR